MTMRKLNDIRIPSETRYTAGYRACNEQRWENTQKRVKRKEEALERARGAFKRAICALVCFAIGIGSIWAAEGDITFAVFSILVGLVIIFRKDVLDVELHSCTDHRGFTGHDRGVSYHGIYDRAGDTDSDICENNGDDRQRWNIGR